MATDARGSTRPARGRAPRDPKASRRVLLAGLAAVLVLGAVGVMFAVYTERPQFCPTCHEMTPYYDAWTAGPHRDISCVDCHVDRGVVNHALHKFVALQEVWHHFTRNDTYPNYSVELPNARCEACHPKVKDTLGAKFSHAVHAGKARCKDCHATAGHTVMLAALDAAGILKPNATEPPTPGGMTPSSAAGHVRVACQRCHDQAKMRCALCHKAPHEVKPGDCSACHSPGAKFLFQHTSDAACAKCHKAPAGHFAGDCASCHKSGGKTWGFTHPASNACASCHRPPPNHFGDACATCHQAGVAFRDAVFRHTGNTGDHSYRSFACVKCHPRGYATASCTCHGGKPPSGD